MPHEDDNAGKLDHADKDFQRVFPPHREATEFLEPGKETFYLPRSAITTEGSSILSMGAFGCYGDMSASTSTIMALLPPSSMIVGVWSLQLPAGRSTS